MGLFLIILCVVLAIVFVSVVMALYGKLTWHADIHGLFARMNKVEPRVSARTFNPKDIESLPIPVQRYLLTVLHPDQPMVEVVNIEHSGIFNMGKMNEKWVPFHSNQWVSPLTFNFLWDARVRMMLGLSVFVTDAYIAGQGILVAKLFGWLTMMKQPQTSQLAQSELMRFLAEAAWYPTAFLPGQGVQWKAIDDKRAMATMTDKGTAVQLVFNFNEFGLIDSVYSDGRYREIDGMQVKTPWEGRFWDYQWCDGMMVPQKGEVAWLLSDGTKPYWRGKIDRIEYKYL